MQKTKKAAKQRPAVIAEAQHTPTPWEIQNRTGSPAYVFIGHPSRKDKPIAQIVITMERQRSGEDRANAAFILCAANAHDRLVEACKLALEDLRHFGLGHLGNNERARFAIQQLASALAEVGSPQTTEQAVKYAGKGNLSPAQIGVVLDRVEEMETELEALRTTVSSLKGRSKKVKKTLQNWWDSTDPVESKP